MKRIGYVAGLLLWLALPGFVVGQLGLWTSTADLAAAPMSGPAWQAVLKAANQSTESPSVADQDDQTNIRVLAAAIVYARSGETYYKQKVEAACSKVAYLGNPGGRTLAWARKTGTYALAADLVGYRTPGFEKWLRNMAEVYVGDDGRTLRQMFESRPNNWGSHAFGSLAAIYAYLQDRAALQEIRAYWIKGVAGNNSGLKYGDLSWQADAASPRLINPAGAMKDGMNIDGVIPDDMRRGGEFHAPPQHTYYPWEFMQGVIMAARILDRAGLPIWDAGDKAIYRAANCLQVRFERAYGGWAASGDDEWMLPFLDTAYGTNWSSAGDQRRLWGAGKNVGFPYVLGGQATSIAKGQGDSSLKSEAGRSLRKHGLRLRTPSKVLRIP